MLFRKFYALHWMLNTHEEIHACNCHFYYKSNIIKKGPVSWEREQSVPFPVAFLLPAGHKHPLFHTQLLSAWDGWKENDSINVHCIQHLCPFARKGEAGLKSPLFGGWNDQSEIFSITTMPQTSSLVKSHFFLGESTPEETPKKHPKSSNLEISQVKGNEKWVT